jgi:hypothetical protein
MDEKGAAKRLNLIHNLPKDTVIPAWLKKATAGLNPAS